MDLEHTSVKNEIDQLLQKTELLRLSDTQQTLLLAEKALTLSKQINYEFGIALSNYRIADVYINLGKYTEAIILLFNSLDYMIKNEYYDLQWLGYNYLGIIFSNLGDYEKSMNFHNNAKLLVTKMNKKKQYSSDFSKKKAIVITSNNIAETYKFLKDYKSALKYCIFAYNIDKKYNFSLSKGIAVLSLGEIYYLIEQYEKSSKLASDSLKYFSQYGYTLAEADSYKLLALTYWKNNDFFNAEKYFKITIDMNKKQASVYYAIETFIDYHAFLKIQGKFTECLEALTYAHELSKLNDIIVKIAETSGLLANFYELIEDKENSYKYYKLYYEYSNKRLVSFNQQLVKNFNIKNEINEIEKRNESLRKKSADLETIVEKISIISKLGQDITSITDLDSIMDVLYSSTKTFISSTYFAIGLYDEKTSFINYLDVIDNDKKLTGNSISLENKNSIAVRCIKSKEIIIINDMSTEYPLYLDETIYRKITNENNYELNSLVFWPLLIKTKVIGVLTIQSKEKNAFNSYQIEMVRSLSSYAAIAINNALKSMELENLNRKLLFLSEHDSMTQIHNRGKFDNYLYNLWNIGINKHIQISLLLIDIDYFKEYNDNYGHVAGDECILKVANVLKEGVENNKFFSARYGGDEFILVIPSSDLNKAVKLGKIIKDKIYNLNIEHNFSKISNKVTVSIGAASTFPTNGMAINEFIRSADSALYYAKKNGRNQVGF